MTTSDPARSAGIVIAVHDRGFGFVRLDGRLVGDTAFLHRSDYDDLWPPCVGQRVTCSTSLSDRGLRAHDVRPEEP